MIYRFIAAFALIAFIIGSVLLSGQHERTAIPSPIVSQQLPLEPQGYAAKHARLVQTGPDGRPLYVVEAEEMQQRPDAGTVELAQVQVGFRDDGGNLWTATGDHGSVGQETGQVDLEGNVHVNGLLPGTQDEAQLATERLHVDTQVQNVRTSDQVTMVTSNQRSQLRAQGLFADLKSGRVRLLSAVHGVFLP
jgi:LPS export ABC transporter protein LptC